MNLATHTSCSAKTELERRLAIYTYPYKIDLILTENRRTMISACNARDRIVLRLHHMFLSADATMLAALANYVIKGERRTLSLLSAFISANRNQIKPNQPHSRKTILSQRGICFNLKMIYDEINQRYFRGAINADIAWGPRPKSSSLRRRRNSIKMGSYSVEDRMIRIHPLLDQAFIPLYFVSWIVYHEMLHQKHDIPVIDGRRRFHTSAFLAEERLFEEYNRAQQWERVHLNRLLFF